MHRKLLKRKKHMKKIKKKKYNFTSCNKAVDGFLEGGVD